MSCDGSLERGWHQHYNGTISGRIQRQHDQPQGKIGKNVIFSIVCITSWKSRVKVIWGSLDSYCHYLSIDEIILAIEVLLRAQDIFLIFEKNFRPWPVVPPTSSGAIDGLVRDWDTPIICLYIKHKRIGTRNAILVIPALPYFRFFIPLCGVSTVWTHLLSVAKWIWRLPSTIIKWIWNRTTQP